MSRQIVFGDIHGAKRAFDQVIKQIDPQPDDHLIFLGDYYDGYSECIPLVDALMELKCRTTFLAGNHDIWVMQLLGNNKPSPGHLKHGGQVTYDAFMQAPEHTRKRHLEFIQSMHFMYVDSKGRLFVHAGFNYGPGHDDPNIMTWDKTMFDAFIKEDMIWPFPFIPGKDVPHVFIGHTSTEMYHWRRIGNGPRLVTSVNDLTKDIPEGDDVYLPVTKNHVTAMDTGCGWFGRLTAMDCDTGEIWQSEPTSVLYTDEQGRMASVPS